MISRYSQMNVLKFFNKFQIHPLFGLRMITYPLTALATYLNFWLISSEYGNSLFNLFLIAWMLIGTVQVLEYAFGVQIMNSVALHGFQESILREVRRNILVLAMALFLIFNILNLPPSRKSLARYLTKFPSTVNYNPQQLLSIFFIVLFLSGCYQLISRILLGLQMNAFTQLAGLTGYLLSSLFLYTYLRLESNSLFWVAFLLGLSPIAISLIPAIYLVNRVKPVTDIVITIDSKKFTGFQYGAIYFVVSLLSTFNVYYPRVMTNLRGEAMTGYLMTFTVVGIFMNISSSLSQLIWVENIKDFPSRSTISMRYRRALLASIYSFPVFAVTSFLLFRIYSKLEASMQIWSLIGLAFILFLAQNIHLISSSMIITKKDLIIASSFLVVQNIFLVFFSRWDNFGFSPSAYLIVLIASSILSNYLPALILVQRRIKENEFSR